MSMTENGIQFQVSTNIINTNGPVHLLGSQAKVLLSSVFGPYIQDDEYGGRKINPMELFQNQVTRVQGPFSIRMFHPSFGIMMIKDNISAPCTVLDFPTLDRFIEEIKSNSYDIVGITSILCNIGKAKKMCELVREYLPNAIIVIGGHLANKPDIQNIVDADQIVKGEGIRWFRKFLREDENAPIKHPVSYVRPGLRVLGIDIPHNSKKPENTAAALIPSLGCPVGCNFCSTSAKFGGKGKFINFYETGDSLFKVMCNLEEKLKTESFFVFDENFLLHRPRALGLLELMKKHNKIWSLYIFSSARVLKSYTIEQLVGLGISWVWMGLEGKESQYTKLSGIDTRALVKELQSHGVSVLGSSIIGMEEHTPENIDEVIDWAVSHDTVFHQFMLYTPLPGTALFEEHTRDGSILSDEKFSTSDCHGQYKFNFRHKHIHNGQEKEFILRAFNRDFEVNGPSIARMIRAKLMGYQRHKNDSDLRIRKRFELEINNLKSISASVIWATKKWYRKDKPMHDKMGLLLQDLYKEFGWKTRTIAPLLGRVIHFTTKMEAKRLANGWTYEPPTTYIKNASALELEKMEKKAFDELGQVEGVSYKLGDKVLKATKIEEEQKIKIEV